MKRSSKWLVLKLSEPRDRGRMSPQWPLGVVARRPPREAMTFAADFRHKDSEHFRHQIILVPIEYTIINRAKLAFNTKATENTIIATLCGSLTKRHIATRYDALHGSRHVTHHIRNNNELNKKRREERGSPSDN